MLQILGVTLPGSPVRSSSHLEVLVLQIEASTYQMVMRKRFSLFLAPVRRAQIITLCKNMQKLNSSYENTV